MKVGSLGVFSISGDVSECPPVRRKYFLQIIHHWLMVTALFIELSLLFAPKFLAKSAALFQQNFHDARGVSPRVCIIYNLLDLNSIPCPRFIPVLPCGTAGAFSRNQVMAI